MNKITSQFRDDIDHAKSLLEEIKYKDALGLLEKISAREGLSEEDCIECMLLKSRCKFNLNDFEGARRIVENLLQIKHKQKNFLITVDALGIKADSLWRLGELDKALESVKEGERIIAEIQVEKIDETAQELKKRKGSLLSSGGIIYWYKGEMSKAIEYHQLSLKIAEELGNLQDIANSLNNLGLVYWSKGDLNQAEEYYQRSLAIHDESGNKRGIGTVLSNLGNVYSMKGYLDAALEFYQRSLAIRMELDTKHDLTITLINIGTAYQFKGELDRALDYYQRSLVISEELNIRTYIALSILNIGSICLLKGELGQALEHFQTCLEMYKELGIKQKVALVYVNIGDVHRKKGNNEQAHDFYEQSLKIYEEIENNSYVAVVLLSLVSVALDKEDQSLAQHYLNKLEQINERTENKIIKHRYRLAKALILKFSKRTRHKIEAGKILDEVIKDEIRDHRLTVTAMIHRCDLLISELKLTGEEELFGEIKQLMSQLLEIAQKQSSHSLLAETYLLQSKLALIELDMGRARTLLDQALSIAENKGLNSLVRVVKQEHDLLQSQLKKWESIIKQNPTKQEMVNITHIDALLERMIHETVVSVMDEKGISGEVPKKKYQLVYLDRLKDPPKTEKNEFRVGIAQIGVSKTGNIFQELYQEYEPGLFGLREDMVESVQAKVKQMVEAASKEKIDILVFPELTVDIANPRIQEDIFALAKRHRMLLIPGSYHDQKTKQNVSVAVSSEETIWEQTKHIPAMIHFEGKRLTEGIARKNFPQETIICSTEFGRIAIAICRDFLDMDLRVCLKNADPPVDIIINPAFTPVTADFKAAHFDARRSIYAYCFFANVAEFGDSLIYTPEKERIERNIPAGEEGLIYKEVDLFKLRSERKKWELEHAKNRPFIQSTR